MSEWAQKYASSKWTRLHENGLVTHGSTEPVLSVLDVLGVEIRDMFLVGINDKCGSIFVPTEQRANELSMVMEAAYATKVTQEREDWMVTFDQRDQDGSVRSHFITEISIKDPSAPGGVRTVMKNGKWLKD